MSIMGKTEKDSKPFVYVEIDEKLCNGCVLCMKACPTKAIRVEDNRVARIQGVCIDCGECVRVCPRGAIKPIFIQIDKIEEGIFSIVSSSAVLYSQFGGDVMPNDVLLALRRMGFSFVYDQGYTNEIFNIAVELYIQENRKKLGTPWPLISPICPVVVRLIAYRFPSLLKHIPPFLTPSEIVAREGKNRLSTKYGYKQEDIIVYHITPCAAKMISMREPVLLKSSYLNRAMGIGHIYNALKKTIHEVEEDKVLHHSGGIGIGWGMSGGEIAGVDANCIAVSGLSETMRYLEKIEMGLLHELDYVEFRICTEGCLGGPFAVADKYEAKHHIQKLIRMFGVEKRVKYEYVKSLYESGWFFTHQEAMPLEATSSNLSVSENIDRQKRIDETLKLLPRKECGACGSPDCRTFAEDVIDGMVSLESCVFLSRDKKKIRISGKS